MEFFSSVRERPVANLKQHGSYGGWSEMDELGFVILGLSLSGCAIYILWRLRQERPGDRAAIDVFVKQRGLRIISMEYYSGFRFWFGGIFRYWFRGIMVSNIARLYIATVEDSEGVRADVHVAFDFWFGSGQLEVLEPRGLALTPPGQAVSLTQNASVAPRLSWLWYEWLALFAIGAGIGGFLFFSGLRSDLSPKRPAIPDTALGYTHLLRVRYGSIYVTHFEYLAATYGPWASWGGCFVSGAFAAYFLKIGQKARALPLQILAAAAISYALYCAIWRTLTSS